MASRSSPPGSERVVTYVEQKLQDDGYEKVEFVVLLLSVMLWKRVHIISKRRLSYAQPASIFFLANFQVCTRSLCLALIIQQFLER